MNPNPENSYARLSIEKIRLLIDEKQTSISVMNSGIFILLSQLLINGILIVMSQFYDLLSILHLVIPFYIINILLLVLAGYLVIHSLIRIRHFNQLIRQMNMKKDKQP